MKKITLLVALLAAFSMLVSCFGGLGVPQKRVHTQEASNQVLASDEVSIVVSSDGFSKDEAVKTALRSAIEQTFGAFVSSNTTVLNDQLVNDEIVSLSNGNVKSYEILTESTLPNNRYFVTLRATICMNKLVNYINSNSKNTTVEVNMDSFDKNIRLAEMNRMAEKSVLDNVLAQVLAMDNLFDYELQLSEPTIPDGMTLFMMGLHTKGEYYYVKGKVLVKYNNNTDLAIDLLSNTIEQIKMSKEEIKQYEKMNIAYYKIDNTPNIYGSIRGMRDLKLGKFEDEHKFGTNFPTNKQFFLRNKPGGSGLFSPLVCGFIFETHHRSYRFNSAFFIKKIDEFVIGDNVSTPTQLIVNLGNIEHRYSVGNSVYCKNGNKKHSVGDVIAECEISIFIPKESASKYKSFSIVSKQVSKQ